MPQLVHDVGLPILLISFELGCQGFLGIEHFDDPFFSLDL